MTPETRVITDPVNTTEWLAQAQVYGDAWTTIESGDMDDCLEAERQFKQNWALQFSQESVQ
jgi:hypothetical protein